MRHCGIKRLLAGTMMGLAASSSPVVAQPAFRTIPPSLVYGVSGDGTTVVGVSGPDANGRSVAGRWREGTGWQLLGGVPEPFIGQALAFGTSQVGDVVVGRSMHTGLGQTQAFRWTEQTGMVGLGGFAGKPYRSQAHGVSADGSVAVGYGILGFTAIPFRWTAESGMTMLLGPSGTFWPHGIAYGVSADGSVVIGTGETGPGATPPVAFRWTQETGMVSIGNGGRRASHGIGISADGSTIVGHTINQDRYEAFRWSAATGFINMGHMPGVPHHSAAVAASADGSVIVGDAGSPFVWDQQNGMRYLHTILVEEFGVDMTGFSLEHVYGISHDGRTIVGTGLRLSTGTNEGWIAVIPGPGTAGMAMAAGAGIAARRRRPAREGVGGDLSKREPNKRSEA